MKLTFLERLMIMNTLPEKGSFISVKAIRKLREALAPSDEEVKRMDIIEDKETGQITWDMAKDIPIDIEIGEIAFEIIKKKLKDMDAEEKLTANHESIYSMFVD